MFPLALIGHLHRGPALCLALGWLLGAMLDLPHLPWGLPVWGYRLLPGNVGVSESTRGPTEEGQGPSQPGQGGLQDIKSTGPEDGGWGIHLLILCLCVWLCSFFKDMIDANSYEGFT